MRLLQQEAKALGQQTVDILRTGWYITDSGKRIDIAHGVAASVAATSSYPPGLTLTQSAHGICDISMQVRAETSLKGAQHLLRQGLDTVVLNFGSAFSPGGGFLNGAMAQEEYLARSTALWATLLGNPMYTLHSEGDDPFFTDYVIHSPDVMVIRSDDGSLLPTPYTCSFITAPAVQASNIRCHLAYRTAEIRTAMFKRIVKVLSVAYRHGHKGLVLGAWGCGAYGNDPAEVAMLFKLAIEENFKGAFAQVVFSITDSSPDQHTLTAFQQTFANLKPSAA